MTDLLDRSTNTIRAGQLPDVGPAPPTAPPTPPVTPPREHAPWPRNAKVVVAILAVAVLLAGLGTFFATRTSDDGEIADQREQIEQLTIEQTRLATELETATARVTTLTAERDALDAELVDVEAQLATATTDIQELTAERDALLTERTSLEASLAAAEAEVANLEALLATATDTTATLDERLAVLDVQVGQLLDRATKAEAERDALLDLFPIEFESSLDGVDLAGRWNLTWDEAYCTGFATCGTNPTFTRLTITETSQDWLRASADGVFDAGLFDVEGALYGITQSWTAAPACAGTQRLAHVGMTLYAHDVSVADDGTPMIEDLAATYVVDAPATGTCPAGLAVYSAQLTPVS